MSGRLCGGVGGAEESRHLRGGARSSSTLRCFRLPTPPAGGGVERRALRTELGDGTAGGGAASVGEMSLAGGRAPRKTAGNRLSGLLEAEEEDEFYQTTYGGFTEARTGPRRREGRKRSSEGRNPGQRRRGRGTEGSSGNWYPGPGG